MTNVSIVLDERVYFAGDTLTGKVFFDTDTPKTIKGIQVKIRGHAHVQWQEHRSRTRNKSKRVSHTVTDTYSASEEYFLMSFNFLNFSTETIVNPGHHAFPFAAALPNNLPTSFEDTHGFIRYTIRATVKRDWKFDYVAELSFPLLVHVDLNYHPIAKDPVKRVKETRLGCCRTGPFSLIGFLPHGGFTSEQQLFVTVEIDNASAVSVRNVEFILKRVAQLFARGRTKTHETELTKFVQAGPGLGNSTWTQPISLPQIPFVNIEGCKIINCNFTLEVKAVTEGMHFNQYVYLPLIMGTIPINSRNDSRLNQYNNDSDPPPSYETLIPFSIPEDNNFSTGFCPFPKPVTSRNPMGEEESIPYKITPTAPLA